MPPPDRWEIYTPVGNPIPGTRIVCCKVPLKKNLCKDMPENEQFTPETLKTLVSEMGFELKLVIDLTYTTKYYAPYEFTRQGVHHEKIFTEGHMIPSDDVVYRLFDVLEKFSEDNTDEKTVAAIHCTHGVNRTGYLVCRYMIERLEFDPIEAIRAYGEARGHEIERKNYLQDLHTRSLNTSYKYEGREKLPMVKKEWSSTRKTFQDDGSTKKFEERSDRRSAGWGHSRMDSENGRWKHVEYSQTQEKEGMWKNHRKGWSSSDEHRRRSNDRGYNNGHNFHSHYHNGYSHRSAYSRDQHRNGAVGERDYQNMYTNNSYGQRSSQYSSHKGRTWHRGYRRDRGRERYQGHSAYHNGYDMNQSSSSRPENMGNTFFGSQDQFQDQHQFTYMNGDGRNRLNVFHNREIRTRSRSPRRSRK